ncbi:MAG TPA: DcaP family trimeric outer membrane transporter [Methyloceanibacter sp.]|nr:DcaP family trimeric outer membrane transporter [Methyloceanibacter sp.]
MKRQLSELEARVERLAAQRERRRSGAPAAALTRGSQPRSWKLPGTNTSMRIGGYVKLDLIVNLNAISASSSGDDGSSLGDAPIDGTPAARRQGNTRLHARQSRFFIRTWTPTKWGRLDTRIEGDFFGAGGDEIISNSNSFRIRHAYGSFGPLLAGQTYTNLFQGYGDGETIETGAPGGKISARQGQIRYTHRIGDATRLAISVENPETGSTTGPGAELVAVGGIPGALVAGSTFGANDPMPVFAIHLNHRHREGTFGIVAGLRRLHIDNGAGVDAAALGWIVQLAGRRALDRHVTIGGNIYVGKGFGRGISHWDTSAVLRPAPAASARLHTVFAIGGSAWAQTRWTPTLRSNLIYSRSFIDIAGAAGGKAALPVGAGLNRDLWRAIVNLIWSPLGPRVDLGMEYAYGFRGTINGPNGKLHRIQASLRVRF